MSYNYRNKQQAGTRLSNTTCGWLRRDEEATLFLPSSIEAPSGDNFLPRGFNSEEVLMHQMAAIFRTQNKPPFTKLGAVREDIPRGPYMRPVLPYTLLCTPISHNIKSSCLTLCRSPLCRQNSTDPSRHGLH